jgi:hypothetical protein
MKAEKINPNREAYLQAALETFRNTLVEFCTASMATTNFGIVIFDADKLEVLTKMSTKEGCINRFSLVVNPSIVGEALICYNTSNTINDEPVAAPAEAISTKDMIEVAGKAIHEVRQRMMSIDLMDYDAVADFMATNGHHLSVLLNSCEIFRNLMDAVKLIQHQQQLANFEKLCKSLRSEETPTGIDVSDYQAFVPALRSDAEELLNQVETVNPNH